MRRLVPSAITLLGMLAALTSMVWAPSHPYWSCLALITASLCDMIDGRVARLLGAQSEFGQQLDSLIDVVAFGVAPAFLAFHWALAELPVVAGLPSGLLLAFVFMAATAVRLARFNLGGQPEGQFVGVPSPVGALLVTTLVMAAHEMGWTGLNNPAIVGGVLIGTAALMVAPLTFPSYKRFKTRWGRALFYGSITVGVSMLLLQQPGGTVLLLVLGGYVFGGFVRLLKTDTPGP